MENQHFGSQKCSQNEISDIGTEILNLQCLNYSQNQLFCKSIIPEEIKSPGPVLYFGSAKIRFKAFWDIFSKMCMRPWIRRLRFSWIFAPRGRLSYEAYNVERYDTYSPNIKLIKVQIEVKLPKIYIVVRPSKPTKN